MQRSLILNFLRSVMDMGITRRDVLGKSIMAGLFTAFFGLTSQPAEAVAAEGEVNQMGYNSLTSATTLGANTIVLFGDSVTAQNGLDSDTLLYDRGYFNWANTLLGGRFKVIHNAGVGGNRTDQMLARIQSDVLAYNPDWCLVMGGINDIAQGVSAAVAFSNLQRIFSILTAAGIRVVTSTATPSISFDSVGEKMEYFRFNRLIRDYALANPGIILADMGAAYIDPTQTYPQPVANATIDGVHPSAFGAALMGRILADAVRPFVPAVPLLTNSNSDPFNLATNGMRTGTGGTLGGGITGAVATGWTLVCDGTGTSVVGSKVPRTDGLPGEWQQVQISPGGIATSVFQTIAAGFSVGDRLFACMEYQTDADLTGLTFLQMNFYVRDAGGATLLAGNGLHHEGAYPALAVIPGNGIIVSRPITVPVGAANTVFGLKLAATSGTFRLGRSQVCKVSY